jgi:hypothetical protein
MEEIQVNIIYNHLALLSIRQHSTLPLHGSVSLLHVPYLGGMAVKAVLPRVRN